MRIKLSSRFVSDAVLSPDGRSAALLTLGLEGSAFTSRLEFYQLSRTEDEVEPDTICPLGNCVGLDLCWKNDGVWVLGDSSCALAKADGTLLGRYDYAGAISRAFLLGATATPFCFWANTGLEALPSWWWWMGPELRLPGSRSAIRSFLSPQQAGISLSSPPDGWTSTSPISPSTALWKPLRAPGE